MDKITIERISQAHPKLRDSLLQQYKEINSKLSDDESIDILLAASEVILSK